MPKDREDGNQVYLLPLDGGEARRLTDLPRGVDGFEWSPDGSRLVVVSASHGATRAEDDRRRGIDADASPGTPPPSDYRFIDRLDYMLNGAGFTYDQVAHLWLVDVATGEASRLTDGPRRRRRAGLVAGRHAASPSPRTDAATPTSSTAPGHPRRRRRDAAPSPPSRAARARSFTAPTWLPDGRTIAALGHRMTGGAGSRNDIWLFAADGRDATPAGGRNLSGRHDLMPGSAMNSDVTRGEGAAADRRRAVGRWLHFTAPIDGAYELWRIAVADGRVERLTDGRHYISGWHAVAGLSGRRRGDAGSPTSARRRPSRPTCGCSMPARPDEPRPRRLTAFNADVLADLELRAPGRAARDGRRPRHPGLVHPGAAIGPHGPLVVEIHGGPHTLYGWSPVWEFQVLAAAGIGVFYCNPRGSEGYGEAFNDANHRDWGPGPMRDVLAGVDALVADGLADPDRLGVTGGSYGGYLTSWIVGHDQRFRAAMTCRSVNDMGVLFTDRRHLRRRLGAARVRDHAVGGPGLLPRDLAAHLRRPDPDAAAHPALRARHPDDHRPGRGAVHGPALAPPAGPAPARPRGDPRAHPLRDAVPPGREPARRRSTGSATSWSTASAACRRCPRSAAAASARRRPPLGRAGDEVYPLRPMTATRRPDIARPRARPRADPRLGRAPGAARQPARAGHRGRPGRGRGAGRRAQASARSRRRRSCGRSTSRSR